MWEQHGHWLSRGTSSTRAGRRWGVSTGCAVWPVSWAGVERVVARPARRAVMHRKAQSAGLPKHFLVFANTCKQEHNHELEDTRNFIRCKEPIGEVLTVHSARHCAVEPALLQNTGNTTLLSGCTLRSNTGVREGIIHEARESPGPCRGTSWELAPLGRTPLACIAGRPRLWRIISSSVYTPANIVDGSATFNT